MVLHPDFSIGNGHHSNVEFKPQIACQDYDQTYDALRFTYLPTGFNSIIEKVGIPCFEEMFIDRYTPDNYLWAFEYSDHVYNLLKDFNFSPNSTLSFVNRQISRWEDVPYVPSATVLNSRQESTPTGFRYGTVSVRQPAYGDPQPYIVEPPYKFLNEDNYKPFDLQKHFLTLDKGEYVLCYMYFYNSTSQLFPTKGVNIINKGHYKFNLLFNTKVDLGKWLKFLIQDKNNIDIDYYFCANSVVLSKLNNNTKKYEEVQISGLPDYFLYSKIETEFSKIKTEINDYFTNLINSYPEASITPLNSYVEKASFDYDYAGGDKADDTYVKPKGFINFSYAQYPTTYLTRCYLSRANNNKWGSKDNLKTNDLGRPEIFYERDKTYSLLSGYSNLNIFNQNYYNIASFPEQEDYALTINSGEDIRWLSKYSYSFYYTESSEVYDSDAEEWKIAGDYPDHIIFIPYYFMVAEKQKVIVQKPILRGSSVSIVRYKKLGYTPSSFVRVKEGFDIYNQLFSSDEFYETEWESDQEYLDYLLQLKEQYEEDSKSW